MADVIPFSYRQGDSLLHLLDVRCKFFIICLISMSIVSAPLSFVLFYGLILLLFFKNASLNLMSTLSRTRYFILLIIFVFAARAFAVKGDPFFSFYTITISHQGVAEGLLVALKFFLVLLTGLLFSSTTRPSCVKAAAQWFLKPVPFVPEKRVAVMISLSLGFMPVILKQSRVISDAQKARCADLQKNPVKRIIRHGFPLLKKAFLSADNLVLAMESRCYTDDRTDPEFTPSGNELYFIAGSIALSLSFLWP